MYQDGVLSKTEIKEVTASVGTLSIMTFHLQLCSKLSKVVLILDTCYMKQNNSSSVYSQRLNITFHTIKSTTFPFNTSFTLNIFVFSVKRNTQLGRQTIYHGYFALCQIYDLMGHPTGEKQRSEEAEEVIASKADLAFQVNKIIINI